MNAITRTAAQEWCCDSCGPVAGDPGNMTLTIACTLGGGDFRTRVAQIEALSRRALRASSREPLRLHLAYAPDALDEVRALVAAESECCAFLDFDLREDADGVTLTITAPPAAGGAADELFAHFAPHLAARADVRAA